MNKALIDTLLDKKIIGESTLVYGRVKTEGLGGTPQYVAMELMILAKQGDKFICRDRLGRRYKMEFERIEKMDGMELDRFASVYNIKPDGSSKAQGKKRGRKPKSAQINTTEGELHG